MNGYPEANTMSRALLRISRVSTFCELHRETRFTYITFANQDDFCTRVTNEVTRFFTQERFKIQLPYAYPKIVFIKCRQHILRRMKFQTRRPPC